MKVAVALLSVLIVASSYNAISAPATSGSVVSEGPVAQGVLQDFPSGLRKTFWFCDSKLKGLDLSSAKARCISLGWENVSDHPRDGVSRFRLQRSKLLKDRDVYVDLFVDHGGMVTSVTPVIEINCKATHIDTLVSELTNQKNMILARFFSVPELKGYCIDAPIIDQIVISFTHLSWPSNPMFGVGYVFFIRTQSASGELQKTITYWAFSGRDPLYVGDKIVLRAGEANFVSVPSTDPAVEAAKPWVFIRAGSSSSQMRARHDPPGVGEQ